MGIKWIQQEETVQIDFIHWSKEDSKQQDVMKNLVKALLTYSFN